MIPIRELNVIVRGTLDEWWRLSRDDLLFDRIGMTTVSLVAMIGLVGLVLAARALRSSRAGHTHLTLPALLPAMRQSWLSGSRHLPFLLFLAGLPLFALALADPHTAFTREEVSYPGRRIAIVIDGSSSMILNFEGERLRGGDGSAFYTTVAAAEHFMKLRMDGPYRDLVALLEFGNESYVVTPFTTDYENVLLRMMLVGEPRNWGRFDDWGTTISQGIRQGVELFRTFDFLNASGNLMVILTDGRDDQVVRDGQHLDDLIAESRKYDIPVFMIRVAEGLEAGALDEDAVWRAAVERTGGRFYAAATEDDIFDASEEIDKLSAGTIDVRRYTAYHPRFSGYALVAVALWLVAATLKLGPRQFRTFP
ncbi:MAG: VWA domain-containing protein [Acidobacteriota bacterium]|nr:VWA domain-containing protein [Acidobacteriota bacterium]